MSDCIFKTCNLVSEDNTDEVIHKELQKQICELVNTTTAKMLILEGKMAEVCRYVKDNLSNSLRELLSDMKHSGELDQLIRDTVIPYVLDIKNELNVKTGFVIVPQMYGAYGDGYSHPVSEKYPTLEQAKIVYPSAQSLNDETDGLAIQKALDMHPDSTVFIPDGVYLVNTPITVGFNQKLQGQSINDTVLKYTRDDGSLIDISNHNHIDIKNLTLLHDFTIEAVGAENTAKAIEAKACPYTRYSNLIIKGFDYGINCGSNSWCSDFSNVTVQTCNYGVYANGEFNNCSFIKYRATYCVYGAYIGAGRTVGLLDCQFESNTTGLYKTNLGDLGARTCYFEGNTQDVNVGWGQSVAYKVSLVDCSFFKGGQQENVGCIRLHGNDKTMLIVKHCSFTKNGVNPQHVVELYSGTNAKAICEDNYLQDGYTVLKSGVNVANVIIRESFTLRKSLNSYRHSHTPTFVTPTDNVIQLTGVDDSVRFLVANDIEVLLPETNPQQNSYELMMILEPNKSVQIKKSNVGDIVNNGGVYTNTSGKREYKMCKVVLLVAKSTGNEYAIVWY